jgi:hypothetical protein
MPIEWCSNPTAMAECEGQHVMMGYRRGALAIQRNRRRGIAEWAIRMLPILLVLGCGYKSGLERVYASGKASYAGKPIEVGQIRFIPIEPTRAPITVENIREGAYETETSGGVPVGTFRVEIKMFDPEEYKNAPRVPGAPAVKQLLPDKYNRESELTMTIDSGSGSIEHDFLLDE